MFETSAVHARGLPAVHRFYIYIAASIALSIGAAMSLIQLSVRLLWQGRYRV